MSDITISPIPYNNGTLAGGHVNGHYVLLNPKQILHVAGQISPNYIYAWVSTISGSNTIKSANPSFVASPMRAIMSFAAAPSTITNMRLWKLTSSRALFLLNNDLYVLEVTAQNDITLRTAKLSSFASGGITHINQGPYSAGTSGNGGTTSNGYYGSLLTGWSVRDNTVWFARRFLSYAGNSPASNSQTGVEMWKVVYDPAEDKLNAGFMQRLWSPLDANYAQYSWTRTYVQAIPNSTKKLVYVRVQGVNLASTMASLNAAHAGAAVGGAAVNPSYPILMIDSVTDDVYSFAYANVASGINSNSVGGQPVRTIVPHSETKWSTWSATNQYRMVTVAAPSTSANGTGNTMTAAPNPSQIFPTPTTATYPWYGEALDSNYFMLISASPGSAEADLYSSSPTPPNHFVRIGRIVDNDIAQISSSTINGAGLSVTGLSHGVLDQEFFQRYDSETFLMFGRSSAGGIASPQIRVWNQPGG